jgi:hypothetical protein
MDLPLLIVLGFLVLALFVVVIAVLVENDRRS